MRTALPIASLALLIAAAPAPRPALARAHGGGVAAPPLNPGDSWTYEDGNEVRGNTRTTHDVITLVRADKDLIIVNVSTAGATGSGHEQILGPEWSRVRSVNGQQTTVNRPLAYPLTPGKTWAVDYSELTPADRRHLRESWHTTYKVGSWEDVSVPAGTFHALRIDADGTWTADLPANAVVARGRAPNGTNVAVATTQWARSASGRTLKTFWYVPEVRRWVKAEEDIFDSNGARTSHSTSNLEAYALAGQGNGQGPGQGAGAPGDEATAVEPGDTPDETPAPKHKSPKHAGAHHPAAVAAHPAAPTAPPAPVAPPPAQPRAPSPPLLQEL